MVVAPRVRIKAREVTPSASPPGYDASARANAPDARERSNAGASGTSAASDARALELERSKLRVRRAFAHAQSSVSSIAMMAFMQWMSGSSVQIFSIMVVFGGVAQTTKAIVSSKATFDAFKDGDPNADVRPARWMFCVVQLAGLLLTLRKLNVMGLLPTHASDWASALRPPRPLERAYGGIEL